MCLARLRLSTTDCLKIYQDMSKDIFENERWSLGGLFRSKFDAEILVRVIKDELKKNDRVDGDPEAPMLEPAPEDPQSVEHICRS